MNLFEILLFVTVGAAGTLILWKILNILSWEVESRLFFRSAEKFLKKDEIEKKKERGKCG